MQYNFVSIFSFLFILLSATGSGQDATRKDTLWTAPINKEELLKEVDSLKKPYRDTLELYEKKMSRIDSQIKQLQKKKQISDLQKKKKPTVVYVTKKVIVRDTVFVNKETGEYIVKDSIKVDSTKKRNWFQRIFKKNKQK